jgi:hypothetical protein
MRRQAVNPTKENPMRVLDSAEHTSVAGGDSVESNLGAGVAIGLHGLASREAQALGLVHPAGWFAGAVLHYFTTH